MSAATQVYYASFDAALLKLPPALRARVEAKIDEIGSQLGSFQHHRLNGATGRSDIDGEPRGSGERAGCD